uniref:Phosphatidylinositol 3-kinase catalytic subunit type 3 n=1 Tax=Romanomermis culicivorax TaxID=13658 RepID=A0A915JDD3_ROMCU
MTKMSDRLHYAYSCDMDQPLQVKIGSLEGKFEKPDYETILKDPSLQYCITIQQQNKSQSIGDGVGSMGSSFSPNDSLCYDLSVECVIFSDFRRRPATITTSFKAFSTRLNWNEWLTLPICYNELSRDARLAFTIYDVHDKLEKHVIGGTSIDLFSKRGVFRRGMYDLKVWPFVQGDGANVPSTTPGKSLFDANSKCLMPRLTKLGKKHRAGMMNKVDWLDRLTFREIEMVNEREKRQSNGLYLNVEFPYVHHENVEHLIVYFEPNADQYTYFQPNPSLITAPDPEMGLDNLVEAKHHLLARSSRIAALRFVYCVNWDLPNEVQQAVRLLEDWSPVDVDAALELLSAKFTHKAVRRYAVTRLNQADDEDLLLYLPQLVQALKYEDAMQILSGADTSFVQELTVLSDKSSRAELNDNSLLKQVENEFSSDKSDQLSHRPSVASSHQSIEDENKEHPTTDKSDEMDLATFLISRACKDPTIANYLYWYVKVECDSGVQSGSPLGEISASSPTHHQRKPSGNVNVVPVSRETGANNVRIMYTAVLSRLSKALAKGGIEAKRRRNQLLLQQRFVNKLAKVSCAMVKESGNRKKKIEFLQHLLTDNQHDDLINFLNLDSLPLPLDPSVKISSILPEKASVFNSANMPCKLVFRCVDGREYTTIFKHGDDLRQDQLIVQIITLMDKCLREENLDLKLTPYRVLATSTTQGFVQFIDSQPLRDLLHDWNTIQEFFKNYGSDANGPFGIQAEIMDNYVKSCAGYAVISYLLGIGDRHQHNLLLCRNGKLFHIDFGYILGRDPKPLPPPMKITKEMIEGMGGFSSPLFQEFRTLCYTGFLHLRRHANLFLNLFALMVDASIPDIALEPDKAVRKVQERFLLHLSEEEAVKAMQQLIDDSISARMAAFVDMMHDVAQYLRA